MLLQTSGANVALKFILCFTFEYQLLMLGENKKSINLQSMDSCLELQLSHIFTAAIIVKAYPDDFPPKQLATTISEILPHVQSIFANLTLIKHVKV